MSRDNEQTRSEGKRGTRQPRRKSRKVATSTVSAEDIRRLVAKLKGEETNQ